MKPVKFGSVCSGIEAASVAWNGLGWGASWFSEIEPFPSAVLKHHYPHVPNLGDMTTLPERILLKEVEAPDVFCGGTPCQAFSVAGNRKSLEDARGNLSLTFCEISNAIDTVRRQSNKPATIVFWENVPGVLNTSDNAFGCFLAGLAGEDDPIQPPGKKWTNAGIVVGPQRTVAWRVLDAQYFGLAQRRKRVFVVASARNGFDPTAVLFERESLQRNTAPSRERGQDFASFTPRSIGGYSEGVGTIRANGGGNVPIALASGQANAEILINQSTALTCLHEAPIVFHPTQDPISSDNNISHALTAGSSKGQASIAIAFNGDTTPCMRAQQGGEGFGVAHNMQVRRLTPVECERLQGFPDNYTAIAWRNKDALNCPDGPRYKALGNSWAIPVIKWIGERIQKELNKKEIKNES